MTLHFLRDALTEIREAFDYYESERPGLGAEFDAELRAALSRILETPFAYSPDKKGSRRTHTRRFLHTIIYLIDGDEIWIVSAAHSSRDSDRWVDRL